MSNNEKVLDLPVSKMLSQDKYIIPIYQRNYAWEEGEIDQLILDISDYQKENKEKNYYIGTLVVYKRKDASYEVIDGQQRLTTLTLLNILLKNNKDYSSHCEARTSINLSFESRDVSTNTLNELNEIKTDQDLESLINSKDYNQGLLNGYKLLKESIKKHKLSITDFCNYLYKKVIIMRVEVPDDTDLNHYFEIMNSRGEQLEKHEVLKARLMSKLDDEDRNIFVKVWDAVSNMERYVQYGFSTDERSKIFGEHWNVYEIKNFDELNTEKETDKNKDNPKSLRLDEILESAKPINTIEAPNKENPERFDSIINFPNFLLHALKVHLAQKGNIDNEVSLDDKKLLDHFKVLDNKEKIKSFTFTLLKLKFLFDHYIIKKDSNNNDESWHLQQLYKSSNSQYYKNSFGAEESDTEDNLNKQIALLLSAMHVSTPTQPYKYWLNGALNILFKMDKVDGDIYLAELENLARKFMYERFIAQKEQEYFDLIYKKKDFSNAIKDEEKESISELLKYGEIKNNFIFNYLDYLIWCDKNIEIKNKDEFRFSFRSSVEHFYPQTPITGKKIDDNCLHSFGNLCLVRHDQNSKLGNDTPMQKAEVLKNNNSDSRTLSLKLQLMIQQAANWNEEAIKDHEEEMLRLLIEDSQS